jgi:trehalose-6-phosphatase
VRIAGVNKGTFADAALLEAHAAAPVDFVLCIGDDEDDEYMMSALSARASLPSMLERLHGRFFTVTVGARVRDPRRQSPSPVCRTPCSHPLTAALRSFAQGI